MAIRKILKEGDETLRKISRKSFEQLVKEQVWKLEALGNSVDKLVKIIILPEFRTTC